MTIKAEAKVLPMPCRDTLFVWFFTWSGECTWLPERLPVQLEETLQPPEDDTFFCEYSCEFCEVPRHATAFEEVQANTTGEQNA